MKKLKLSKSKKIILKISIGTLIAIVFIPTLFLNSNQNNHYQKFNKKNKVFYQINLKNNYLEKVNKDKFYYKNTNSKSYIYNNYNFKSLPYYQPKTYRPTIYQPKTYRPVIYQPKTYRPLTYRPMPMPITTYNPSYYLGSYYSEPLPLWFWLIIYIPSGLIILYFLWELFQFARYKIWYKKRTKLQLLILSVIKNYLESLTLKEVEVCVKSENKTITHNKDLIKISIENLIDYDSIHNDINQLNLEIKDSNKLLPANDEPAVNITLIFWINDDFMEIEGFTAKQTKLNQDHSKQNNKFTKM